MEDNGSAVAPDGSGVAPGGDGNTNPSPPTHVVAKATTKRDSSKKTWIITLNGSNGSYSLKGWIQTHCEKAVWQVEKGNETGYIHIQLTMTLKVKQRLSWLKNHFSKEAHCEVVRNEDAAFDYTQKSDTRVEGPFYWPNPIISVKDPLEGKTLKTWQAEILEIIKGDPDNRTVHWYWEETGNVGKTALCKHLVLKHGANYVLGKKNDIYHALDSNLRVLLIDIPRTSQEFTPYEVIEAVKNGMIFSGKYESRTKVFDSPHVFVFANFYPEKHRLSEDRWHIIKIEH